jgi:hypothetical protein
VGLRALLKETTTTKKLPILRVTDPLNASHSHQLPYKSNWRPLSDSWNTWKRYLGFCGSLQTSWYHQLYNNYQRGGATSEQATQLPDYFIEHRLIDPKSFCF